MLTSLHRYLQRHQVDGKRLGEGSFAPDLIVVMPCYDEAQLGTTIAALSQADRQGLKIELIVVVNSGENSPLRVKEQNRRSYDDLQAYPSDEAFRISPILLENVRKKHAGVGYARKVGMDLAVWRYAQSGQVQGPIVSLDADTLVASNYFQEIYRCFQRQPRLYGLILDFEHRLDAEADAEAIAHYELHLRYVNQALKYAGFPYVHHTIGSAFAVSAQAYVRHGGMNRRQGGEDFYFLHKLFPHGLFEELHTSCVYPSSRPSQRVPFGTGPQVLAYRQSHRLDTYRLSAFDVLGQFIAQVPDLYQERPSIAEPMRRFLESIGFASKLEEIRANAASKETFIKRFFAFFDAFQVVKFLNFAHQEYWTKNDVKEEAAQLLKRLGKASDDDVVSLLSAYRKIEGR